MADNYHRATGDPPDAPNDRVVLGEIAIAGEWREVLRQPVQIMAQMRALRVAGDLRLLPGGEFRIGLLQRLPGFGLEFGELFIDGDGMLLGGERLELGDPAFELGNRLFEIEIGTHANVTAL